MPSVREMILKLPIEGLADIEMVTRRGLGMRYTVRVVHFIATEMKDPNRWYPSHHQKPAIIRNAN